MRRATSRAVQLRRAIGGDGVERAVEVAGRVRRAPPDMALVEMGVRVDEGRQRDPPGQSQGAAPRRDRADARRRTARDAALVDHEVDDAKPSRSLARREGDDARRACARVKNRPAFSAGERNAGITCRGSGRCRASDAGGNTRARSSQEDGDAGDRNEEQRREHARDVEPIAGFDDAEGEACALSGRARRDFGDDRADQRKAAADSQSAEKIGKRRRNAQPQQLPSARGAIKLEEIDEVMIDGGEAERGVGEDREESDQERDDENRAAGGQIDEQQRRNRDDGRHLHDHREREERAFERPPLREERAPAARPDRRRDQRLER